MQTEIEVKFLDVVHDDVRAKLKAAGGELKVPMRLMRRAIIDYPDSHLQRKQDGWVRVRDEGDKVSLTYKEMKEGTVSGAREIEFDVSSFEQTVKLFEAIGLQVHSFQESKRETWQLGEVEVVLDEWPWLKPYIEIEGPSEEAIKHVAEKLGFSWSDAFYGSTTVAYIVEYPGINMDQNETIGLIPEIKFDLPLPEFLEQRKPT
jgi:adenylate cyclase class 2